MTLLNHLKDLFTAYLPMISYFMPFLAMSILFTGVKVVRTCCGSR